MCQAIRGFDDQNLAAIFPLGFSYAQGMSSRTLRLGWATRSIMAANSSATFVQARDDVPVAVRLAYWRSSEFDSRLAAAGGTPANLVVGLLEIYGGRRCDGCEGWLVGGIKVAAGSDIDRRRRS
jgi:hypothetical protein